MQLFLEERESRQIRLSKEKLAKVFPMRDDYDKREASWKKEGDYRGGEYLWRRRVLGQSSKRNPPVEKTAESLERTDSGSKSALSPSRYTNMGKSVNFVVCQSHNHSRVGIIISRF